MYICFVLFLDCERDIDTDEMNDDIDMKNDRFADCLFSCPKKPSLRQVSSGVNITFMDAEIKGRCPNDGIED